MIKAAAVVFTSAALFLTAALLGRLAVTSPPPPHAIELGARPAATTGRAARHRDRLGWTEVPAQVESGPLR